MAYHVYKAEYLNNELVSLQEIEEGAEELYAENGELLGAVIEANSLFDAEVKARKIGLKVELGLMKPGNVG